jgi:hypothetical protein
MLAVDPSSSDVTEGNDRVQIEVGENEERQLEHRRNAKYYFFES